MTIMDAISKTDSLFFNTFCYGDKVALLSKLDWMIQRNLIDTHQGGSSDFHGYDADTDAATQLLAPPPYDQMYLTWLQAQMELWLKETDNYNASIPLMTKKEGFYALSGSTQCLCTQADD